MAKCDKLIILLFIFLLSAYNLSAAQQPEFYSRYMKYSSEQLLKMGNEYAEKIKLADSALVCFSIVVNRAKDDMTVDEKKDVMSGYIGRWYVYFFEYFDYEKSYSNLLQAKHIAEEIGQGLARINLNFGCMYQMMAEQSSNIQLKEKALSYYRKAFEVGVETKDFKSLDMAFSNMIFLSSDLGKLNSIQKEWTYYNKIDGVIDDFNRKYNIDMYYGLKSLEERKYTDAIRLFTKQQQYANEIRYLYVSYH